MDVDIDGDAPATPEMQPERPKVGRCKGHRMPWRTEGPIQLLMLFASSLPTAFWTGVFCHNDAEDYRANFCHPNYLIGYAAVQWFFDAPGTSPDDAEYALLRAKSRRGSRKHHFLCGYLSWRIIEFFPWVDQEQPAAGVVTLRWLRQRHGARKCLITGTYVDERLVCEHLDETEKYYNCKF